MSWEGLATDVPEKREARARNLARALGPAPVLITLRHPVTLIESTYFQILRRNNNATNNPGWRGSVWFLPIEEWLERNWSGELEPILDEGGPVSRRPPGLTKEQSARILKRMM